MSEKIQTLTVKVEKANRLDRFLAEYMQTVDKSWSRTKVQLLIKNNWVFVNNELVNSNNYPLQIDDEVIINFKDSDVNVHFDVIPQKIDFDILYEDNDLLVINKPNGLVCHPAPGHLDHTLVNGLLYLNLGWKSINEMRVGLVHRLDKQTTGVLLVAKNEKTLLALQEMLKKREIKRQYYALVHGVINTAKGEIRAPIGRCTSDRKKMMVTSKNAKDAITKFIVIKQFNDYTYIECELQTGRTHQIRVHCQFINHPVVGDHLYGLQSDQKDPFGQYLHAHQISFVHPWTNEYIEVSAPLPQQFENKLIELESEGGNNEK